ncbi:MAG TPA: UDP-N-acetylmuramoyl-tripeptide--D-alanyl-D-alanine ligase [Candidatus Limnocylindrales bacterium]|nr:UDP-N-acetylmuramoyl-tripeptide--D-alanyl-D-alanine ligase [Candidatus Limnocylindrales bacterium]
MRAPVEPASGPAFSADELVAAAGGTFLTRSGRPIRGGAVDSRLVRAGNLFVALPGERTDGHHFLAAAVNAGAAALVVTVPPAPDELARLGDVTVLLVDDALDALGQIAAAWRSRFDPLVVGVTGSIAKTSTKEAIGSVLAQRLRTLRNEGNRNNEIGLPLTLLDLGPEHEAAVLEMGMYVGGEIRDLAAIGRPRIGVVTAVQPVHLSRIGSIEAIEQAKGELVEALPAANAGGVAVLNADDPRVSRMDARTNARVVRYGFDAAADVTAREVTAAGFDGMRFVVRLADGRERSVSVPGLGRLAVHNALAAAAVGDAAGLDLEDIAAGLAAGWSAPHRTSIVRSGGVTILDDSYNASPGSVEAALEALAGLPGRRVAVLGEMLELGDVAEDGHRRVGGVAAGVVEMLVVVGAGAHGIADGARSAGMPPDAIVVVPDRLAALDALGARLRPGDVVLVKASRGVELDRLVDDLAAAPDMGA